MIHQTCKICEVAFSYAPKPKGRRRLFCSDVCRNEVKAKRDYLSECRTCKKQYRPRYRAAGFCSMECRRYPERKIYATASCRNQAGHSRRIVRKRSAEYERFSALEIYRRDKWNCGICLKPVDQDLKYPDLFCASLDHVVALARGGSHTRANTQCSHFICNSLKADSMPDQMVA